MCTFYLMLGHKSSVRQEATTTVPRELKKIVPPSSNMHITSVISEYDTAMCNVLRIMNSIIFKYISHPIGGRDTPQSMYELVTLTSPNIR